MLKELVLMSAMFALGAFWRQSQSGSPLTKENFNEVVSASLTWYAFVYKYVTELIASLRNTDKDVKVSGNPGGFYDTNV